MTSQLKNAPPVEFVVEHIRHAHYHNQRYDHAKYSGQNGFEAYFGGDNPLEYEVHNQRNNARAKVRKSLHAVPALRRHSFFIDPFPAVLQRIISWEGNGQPHRAAIEYARQCQKNRAKNIGDI